MSNKIFCTVVAAIVMLSAFAGAGMQSAFAFSPAADNAIKIVSLSTDKDIYHLGENMEIVLSVYSPENVSNVLIKVSGLRGRHGSNLVSFSRDANLSAGENKVVFSYRIPSCGCAVSYGKREDIQLSTQLQARNSPDLKRLLQLLVCLPLPAG